jgi:DNA-binding beta-propeller fold protein YncE
MNVIFATIYSKKSFLAIVFASLCIFGAAGCSRDIAQTSAKSQLPPVQYLRSWGVKGDAPGQLKDPTGLATDSFGDVYIADAGNQFIEKFDSRGKALLSFQEGALKHPQSIALDSGGGIYVTDPVRNSVFVFFPEGDRYRELHLKTKSGSENELSVAIGDDGQVHVLDRQAGKVFNYSAPPFHATPAWLVAASVTDAKSHPGPIAVGADGNIYINDPAGNRILRFASDGHFISGIDLNPGEARERLSSAFAAFSSYIFVVGADGHTLHIVPTDGRRLMDVDLAPELGPAGATASALAVSMHREMFALDETKARVLVFRLNF